MLYDLSAAVPKNSSASVSSLGSTPTVSSALGNGSIAYACKIERQLLHSVLPVLYFVKMHTASLSEIRSHLRSSVLLCTIVLLLLACGASTTLFDRKGTLPPSGTVRFPKLFFTRDGLAN